ncbi:hypothetical protein GCM10010344_01620 [Streptomyces bluensis]|nr:hypothetical protein GCM10010344_01620 [Streptomyces bluensis]
MLGSQNRQRPRLHAKDRAARREKVIQDIYNAEDRDRAEAAVKAFAKLYSAKFPKAVKKITEDEPELLAFYDFPAEHWSTWAPRTSSSPPSPPSGCGPRSPAASAPAPPPWPWSSNSSRPPSSGGGP